MQSWYRTAAALRAWNAVPCGVGVVTRDGLVLAWNEALAEAVSCAADDVVGRPLLECFPRLTESALLTALEQVFAVGRAVEIEVDAAHWSPVVDDGAFVGERAQSAVVQTFRIDVRRCSPDDADAALITVLGERLAEEMRRANQELYEARIRAEAAARAKSDFLANMSHEIRTPMTAILGFADVLLHEDGLERAPSHRRQAIETIQRNGEHLLGVLNDILDVSKIESGNMSVERIMCSPFQIVEDVVGLMQVRAESKRLHLLKEYRFPIPAHVYTDPTRLRQILMNLVGNAVKFTESGSVKIRTTYENGPAPRLIFDVVDTGVGVDPDQAAKLFKPFSQADSSTTRRFGGTGLGLTISKRLVEMLGGAISFRSELGGGSTFSFWIDAGQMESVPMRDCERTAPPTDPAGAHPLRRLSDRAGDEPLAGMKILLAEDGADNQRLITFILRKAGAEVTSAENGGLALDAAVAAEAEHAPFDLILMDMQMPVMDGYEATRLLRSRGYTRPIIALTANAMSGDRERCLSAGCNDFATKPIDKQRLFKAILSIRPRIGLATMRD